MMHVTWGYTCGICGVSAIFENQEAQQAYAGWHQWDHPSPRPPYDWPSDEQLKRDYKDAEDQR